MDGPGNVDGKGTSQNDIFGARPYGRAETDLDETLTADGDRQLAAFVRIVERHTFDPDDADNFLPEGPSALLICAYLQCQADGCDPTISNPFIDCQAMSFNIPLVFSDIREELIAENKNAPMQILAGGSSNVLLFSTIDDFLTFVKYTNPTSNPADHIYKNAWNDLNGLYLISFDTGEIPVIRVLHLKNEGLIQNEGIIEIGK
jgi:hypothetical protein